MNAHRRASVLVVIAGVLAMLSTLSVAFLMRMRQDAQESDLVVHLAQCRLMLHAGMQFVQESSRLGYATAADPSIEAWGWIDVRDGAIGPKGNGGAQLWTAGKWPAPGTVKRAPMYMVKRPPFAVVPHMYPNRIPTETDPAIDPQYKDHFGIPVLAKPDPMPAFDPTLGAYSGSTVQRADWVKGDLQPIDASLGLAWFRVYRELGTEIDRPAKSGEPGATFVITVGSGGTQGFKDWAEVTAAGADAQFGASQSMFNSLLAAELRQWYRVEWSAAVGGGEMRVHKPPLSLNKQWAGRDLTSAVGGKYRTNHARSPLNSSRSREKEYGGGETYSSAEPRNYVGTISYIQRLEKQPASW